MKITKAKNEKKPITFLELLSELRQWSKDTDPKQTDSSRNQKNEVKRRSLKKGCLIDFKAE